MFNTRLLFFVLLILKSIYSFSQDVPVKFQGDVSDERGALPSAQVQISRGGRVESTILTDVMGKYNFALPLGGDFLVTVTKDGYVTKKFTVSTTGVPPEKATIKFPIIQASLSLFKKMEGVDYSALNEPLNKYKYNPLLDNFEYDAGYLEQMITKLGTIKEAEQEVIKKEREKEITYQTTIKKGDKAFELKDWETALASYQEAQRLKPKEVYPGTQIINVKKLIDLDAAKKASEDAAAKTKAELDAKRAAELAAAKAKADAELAAKLKAEADASKSKADADALAKKNAADEAAKKAAELAAEKAKIAGDAAAKKAAEDAAIKEKADKEKADKLAKEKAEADAKAKIQAEIDAKKQAEAAEAKAKADKEAAEKLNSEKARAEAAALAKKAADEAAAKRAAELAAEKAIADKAAAEKLAKDKEAAEARAKKAIEMEAMEKKRAEEENKKLQEQESKYRAILAKGDDAFSKGDMLTAKSAFTEAASTRPGDSYPKNRLQEVGFVLKYDETIKVADDLFTAKRYKEAKKKYEESLTYKGGDAYAKGRLLDTEKLLNGDGNQQTDERVKQLLAKYGPGVTEETISSSNVVIIQRVVVKDNMAWVFQKKIFNWGGSAHFRDGAPITESTFEAETRP
ncbi:MAG: carboxypeptidase-like regulatory domain-containing protein [Bacteroidota bacterium]